MRSFWLLFFSLFVLRLPKTWWGKGKGGGGKKKASIYLQPKKAQWKITNLWLQ